VPAWQCQSGAREILNLKLSRTEAASEVTAAYNCGDREVAA
jgi:hypothetical protein